ncbi:MAG: pyrimidine dimer DNA glycosylase/endonuclease V [Methylococcaceae bacterium]|nr:pyrimidine dimer DNA glycosylase/endonuclease V [Methylococcaceae bacterium]
MRLWTLHPKYLDAKGLVALWREALLAQSVLSDQTKGYRSHPQLERFKASSDPLAAIASYLRIIASEADARGYKFNKAKIANGSLQSQIQVTRGQVAYEYQHLLNKLSLRDAERYSLFKSVKLIDIHPLFDVVEGEIASWEIV